MVMEKEIIEAPAGLFFTLARIVSQMQLPLAASQVAQLMAGLEQCRIIDGKEKDSDTESEL